MLRRKILPQSSWSKKKPRKKGERLATCFALVFLGLSFDPEDGGLMFHTSIC
jgi:hypothetical protein